MQEAIPPNAPKPRGKGVDLRMFVDSDHTGDKQTRRSRTGFIIFLNMAPIVWFSKTQATIETSVFGAEFVAMKQDMECLRGLHYKLRMMGVAISGPSYIYGDKAIPYTEPKETKTKTKTFLFSLSAHLHALIRRKRLTKTLNENAMSFRRSWKHNLSPTKTQCVFVGIAFNNGTPHSLYDPAKSDALAQIFVPTHRSYLTNVFSKRMQFKDLVAFWYSTAKPLFHAHGL